MTCFSDGDSHVMILKFSQGGKVTKNNHELKHLLDLYQFHRSRYVVSIVSQMRRKYGLFTYVHERWKNDHMFSRVNGLVGKSSRPHLGIFLVRFRLNGIEPLLNSTPVLQSYPVRQGFFVPVKNPQPKTTCRTGPWSIRVAFVLDLFKVTFLRILQW